MNKLRTIKLPKTLNALDTAIFQQTFKDELRGIDSTLLPLQEALQHSSYANADKLSAVILNVNSSGATVNIKAGLFYTGTIAGCNCADDPSPVDEINEYCEVSFTIDTNSAETTVELIE